jgi:hypothetical protein
MTMSRIAVACALFVALVFGGKGTSVTGQVPSREDALLAEVRGLRLAIEQLATTGARAQLMSGRLQLQEQRMSTLFTRVAQQRDRILPVERELTEMQQRAADLQRALATVSTPQDKYQLEVEQQVVQRQVAVRTAELRRLQVDEADVANLLATEQAQWAELNRQLEQLEAALRR